MKDLGNGFVACCQLDNLFPWSEVDTWFEDNEEGCIARKEIKDKLERGDLYFFTCWTQERCECCQQLKPGENHVGGFLTTTEEEALEEYGVYI